MLAGAPRGGSLDVTRRLLGRRLAAAGGRGPHVVQLLIDAHDHARAAELAAEDLAPHLAAEPSLETWARLRLLLEWSRDEALLAEILRALAARDPSAPGTLASRLVELADADPAAVQRVRSAIVWLDR